MKKTLNLIALLFISLLVTNCASILNGKNQKVKIFTQSADSKVYLDGSLVGTGSTVEVKMPRDQNVKQIRVERKGYRTLNKVHYQTSKSPLYIMSWIPFGVFLYPPLLDSGPKSYNHKKELSVNSGSLKIKERKDDEKYVYLKNTAFDVKKEDLKFRKIKKSAYQKEKKGKEITSFKEDIKFDNSIFTEAVNEVLKSNNYIDSTKTIFMSKTNTLYISSKVTKVDFQYIYEFQGGSEKGYLVTKLDLEWEIFDLYDQSKYKKSFKAESGEFKTSYSDSNYLRESIEDAISESFFKFMDTNEVKKLIKKEEEEKVKFENITLNKGNLINTIEDAMNATVTLKVKDGHGSGCLVSKDGYIITNFHVVSNTDAINVITRDGKEYKAKLIRKNENLDLALIKVDGAVFNTTFIVPSVKNYAIGEDIYVIGTPTSVELGQTLSKGIISNERTFEKNKFIQTDASINGGNSGGALTKKSGELIGIINAKIKGVGVEGLGFSIPAELIQKGLFIQY